MSRINWRQGWSGEKELQEFPEKSTRESKKNIEKERGCLVQVGLGICRCGLPPQLA